jgi:glycosyltransferase involved in cell wall biosynthesis
VASAEYRVSIGLPVYNGEKYLEQALRSLLGQTYCEFELIVCDNASTDRTEDICRAFAASDSRIRYRRNPENLGATRNFNLVFELSSGEYFRWAAYDDLCAPELIERCVAVLDARPSVVLCYPRTKVIDEHGAEVGYHDGDLALSDNDPVRRHKALHRRFRTNAWCDPVFGLVRSEVLRRTALLGNYNSADVVLLQELALLGKFHEIPDRLFSRRVHPQISTRANRTPEAVAAWFDPSNEGRVAAPLWRLALERFRAVARSPLGTVDKTRCYGQVAIEEARWGVELAHEAAFVVRAGLSRLAQRSRS